MKEIQVFNNPEFGQVRTIETDGKILFCGSDVAKALGYVIPHKAVREHCKEDGVTNQTVIDSMGRTQNAKFITEGNVYRLITHSKLPNAQKFESWVFDEVLPTIRRTGYYEVPKVNKYQPTRPLTTDDYIEAAKIVAKCNNGRLILVLDMFRKAGLDIEEIQEVKNQIFLKKDDDSWKDEFLELLNQYTLTELCKMLPIAKSTLYYYKTGEHFPRCERRKEIFRILRRCEV